MKNAILILSLFILATGCSSKEKRTKFSDKSMRIMIDSASISAKEYAKLQTALVANGSFIILDRSKGLKAIKEEQDMLHRKSIDRFEDREKFALYGKLYGAGAVVVANVQCRDISYWTGMGHECQQSINLMDTSTGEVITAVENTVKTDWGTVASWDEAVTKLVDAYPKDFKSEPITARLMEYKAESQEEALRQREQAVQNGITQSEE
ncbi:CsgG/HfaB family protein [Bdellovibrio bacteriovorus]|uniref:CsgG/HfaB family protein n=1 Tax=Bdellovibrio bacteriovorus TaxID=959 RepID=UPI0005A10670|nr:CsgG/HfaB family protein [Bdellovibrio bacteriovorus]